MADPTIPTVTPPKFPKVTLPPNMIPNPVVTPQIPRPLVQTVPIPKATVTTPVVPFPKATGTTPVVPFPTVIRPTTINVTQTALPKVTVSRPIAPVFPQVTVPKPLTPTVPQVTVPRPVTPTVPQVPVPRPVTPTVPQVTVPRPVTPTVPKVTVPRPVTPTVPQVTVPRPVTPTVPQVTVPRSVTPTVPQVTVPRSVTPTVPQITVPRSVTPTVPQVTVPIRITPLNTTTIGVPRATVAIPQAITFSPEMIDEDTIIAYANTLNKPNYAGLLKFLGDYYHNDESLVSDETYDELVDIYEAKYGPYTVVGAEPTGEKVKLPYYLGSLRKLKKDKELTTWLESYPGPYIIEDKIDGLTLLLVSTTELGKRVTKLYTRGGGYRGLDVSHLLGYMRLPQLTTDMAVRGEVVMTREAFRRVGTGFKNARNLVSGIVNAKKQFNPTLARELSFYAYRIMNKGMTAEEDINELRELGFLVPNPVQSQTLTKEILENYYNMRKQEATGGNHNGFLPERFGAPYEMDGLVIYQNKPGEYPEGEEPRHVVAFKTGTETGVTTVTNVVWRASKDKLLKPVVHYETINLSGADLQRASGYNARFIVNNNIGPGAQILLTRSGDVIPKILSVIAPAPGGPSFPDHEIHGKYDWNANGVEFVVTDENPDVIAGRLKHFLDTLGVKNAGMKRVETMVAAGIRSITTLLTVTPNQLADIPGIGPTLSNQFYQDIHDRINNVSLARIMDASGIFEKIGERRFEAILDVYPNLLDLAYTNPEDIARNIRGVRGFNMLADQIAEKLHNFADWLKQHHQITIANPTTLIQPTLVTAQPVLFPVTTQLTLFPTQQTLNVAPQATGGTHYGFLPERFVTQTVNITQPLNTPQQGRNLAGMKIVFSGFSDRDLEDRIRAQGGRVTSTVSKNTTLLVMKDVQDLKGKGQKAIELGVPIVSREEFQRRYL